MMRNSSEISASVRELVGSSKTMIRAFLGRALAISIICWLAMLRFLTRVPGETFTPMEASNSSVRRCMVARSSRRPRVTSWPRKMFSATESSGMMVNS
jgi:hypothetical protein